VTDAASDIDGMDRDESGRSNTSFWLKVNGLHCRLVALC